MHKCSECLKNFEHTTLLKIHFKLYHGTYRCFFCFRLFYSPVLAERHMEKRHPARFVSKKDPWKVRLREMIE